MIVILFGPGGAFPNGTAPTARVLAYGRGFLANNEHTLVLCLGPSEYPKVGVMNTRIHGLVHGIEFEYTSGRTIRGSNIFNQRWLVLKGLINGTWRIIQINRKEKIKSIILYPDRISTSIWFWLIARICKTSYILEKSEKPFLNSDKNVVWKILEMIYTFTIFKLFDGTIVISDYLFKYMKKRIRKNASLFKSTILVNTDEFRPHPKRPQIGKYIAYCGALNEEKDGVLTLLKAFIFVSKVYPKLKLIIIGDGYKKTEIKTYRKEAINLGVEQNVIFMGLLSRNRLPEILSNAIALVLARPSSVQADAGFPTKLGEYLATGKPVVVTRTGEIDQYLEDGYNALLSPPNDPYIFAKKIMLLLKNNRLANEIGKNGRILAYEYFDYRVNTKNLLKWINSLNTNTNSYNKTLENSTN
jgi:glycosyltransferase involved in cell wall biosynthesis